MITDSIIRLLRTDQFNIKMSRSSVSDDELSNSTFDSSETDTDDVDDVVVDRDNDGGEKIKSTRKKRGGSNPPIVDSKTKKPNPKVQKKIPNLSGKGNTTTTIKKKVQHTSRKQEKIDDRNPDNDDVISSKDIGDAKNEIESDGLNPNVPIKRKVSKEKEKTVVKKNKNDLSNEKCKNDEELRGSFVYTGAEVLAEKRIRMKRNVKLTTIVSGLSKCDLKSLAYVINDDYTTFFGLKTRSNDVYIQIHFHQDCFIEQNDILAISVE